MLSYYTQIYTIYINWKQKETEKSQWACLFDCWYILFVDLPPVSVEEPEYPDTDFCTLQHKLQLNYRLGGPIPMESDGAVIWYKHLNGWSTWWWAYGISYSELSLPILQHAQPYSHNLTTICQHPPQTCSPQHYATTLCLYGCVWIVSAFIWTELSATASRSSVWGT